MVYCKYLSYYLYPVVIWPVQFKSDVKPQINKYYLYIRKETVM